MALSQTFWKFSQQIRMYDRQGYLKEFIFTGIFPSKLEWKSIVNNSTHCVQENYWKIRTDLDDDFRRFGKIVNHVELAPFWKMATTKHDCKTIILSQKL